MTPEIISVLAAFAPLFTRPSWKYINTLWVGAILCRGARRITSILRVMGLSEIKNFSKFHRVLGVVAEKRRNFRFVVNLIKRVSL